jgi:hypothetical protein
MIHANLINTPKLEKEQQQGTSPIRAGKWK